MTLDMDERASAGEGVAEMRKSLNVANARGKDYGRISLLEKLATALCYGGRLRTPQDLVGMEHQVNSQDEEVALLLLLLVVELQAGPLDKLRNATTHLGHVLLLHNQLRAYAEVGSRTHPQLMASSPDVHRSVGIAQLASGDVLNAYHTLSNVIARSKDDIPTQIMITKVCLSECPVSASAAAEACAHMEGALKELEGPAPPTEHVYLLPRVLHMRGAALAIAARLAPTTADKHRLQAQAVESLRRACHLEPRDAAIQHELALQLVEMSNVEEALAVGQGGLEGGRTPHLAPYQLMAAINSAHGSISEAHAVCTFALQTLPPGVKQVPLYLLRARLQQAEGDLEGAFQACQKALKLFPANRVAGGGEREQEAAERLFEDKRATCSSANRGTLKDLEGQVWQELVEIYLSLDRPVDASVCCEEVSKAQRLGPSHPTALYCSARILQTRGEEAGARRLYTNTLAIRPDHHLATVHLGLLLAQQVCESDPKGELLETTVTARLAQVYLEAVLQVDSLQPDVWLWKARLYKREGLMEEATACLGAAAQLHGKVPIVPFSSLPRFL